MGDFLSIYKKFSILIIYDFFSKNIYYVESRNLQSMFASTAKTLEAI